MLAGIRFDRARMEEASGDEMLAATEVADLLVRRGVPFREAHGIVGGLVRDAVEHGKSLSELTPVELKQRSELLDESYYEVLQRSSWLESKRIAGGTGSVPLATQLESARETLAAVKARVLEERSEATRERAEGPEIVRAEFFDRSVHDVARDLVGCPSSTAAAAYRRTESYGATPTCHANRPMAQGSCSAPGLRIRHLNSEPTASSSAGANPKRRPLQSDGHSGEPRKRADANPPRQKPNQDLCNGPGKRCPKPWALTFSESEPTSGKSPSRYPHRATEDHC
jgi:hypothetical protein